MPDDNTVFEYLSKIKEDTAVSRGLNFIFLEWAETQTKAKLIQCPKHISLGCFCNSHIRSAKVKSETVVETTFPLFSDEEK